VLHLMLGRMFGMMGADGPLAGPLAGLGLGLGGQGYRGGPIPALYGNLGDYAWGDSMDEIITRVCAGYISVFSLLMLTFGPVLCPACNMANLLAFSTRLLFPQSIATSILAGNAMNSGTANS
jgi:hypothetical protein